GIRHPRSEAAMLLAFRACKRVIQRSPNLFAVAGGLYWALGSLCYIDMLLTFAWRARADVSLGKPVPILVVPVLAVEPYLAKPALVVPVVISMVSAGAILGVLGLVRFFRPRP